MTMASFLGSYQSEKAPRLDLLELAAFRRPRLLGRDLEQVLAVVGDDDHVRGLADRRREDAGAERLVELALGDPAEVAAVARLLALGQVPGELREVGAAIGLGLDLGEVRRVVDDLDDVIAELGLDRGQDLVVGRAWPQGSASENDST